jgi:hypothetical protein
MNVLLPRGHGHQFVFYGDACSGVPDAPHALNFAAINRVIQHLSPPPEFLLFLGDEIAGLTPNTNELKAQWRYWLDREMGWRTMPLWHSTSNHTTYDTASEAVFRDVLNLPRNGPPGQEGLSYWVRRDDLLLVFVHTLWTGLGGEGHVETTWLHETLQNHADARHKLVIGHHPVHSVNGFSGAYQRDIGPEHAADFWDALVEGGVLAYLCSHILAFDAQVHRGVLQICTAGAGTAHRMPEDIEYLHCVQAALDEKGLRYQVFDIDGNVRERLSWPLPEPEQWQAAPITGNTEIIAFRFTGRAAPAGTAAAQTLLSAFEPGVQARLWIGLRGLDQKLAVTIAPRPGRSPHYWFGPTLTPGETFDFQLMLHPGMGPGGILHRVTGGEWSSLNGASAWGAERLTWQERSSVGHAQNGPDDQVFQGADLDVRVSQRFVSR